MIYYRQESYDIVGAAMRVYNTLGHGFLESVYQEALEIELERAEIPFVREKNLRVFYDGIELNKTFKADYVCYDCIIVELKAIQNIDNASRSQLYNYLRVTGFKLGLLFNFGCSSKLEYERIVL
ncbi:MAG: GxxExxY protein [bacterium]|nr:GxxExxY protein [Candidatus Limimorpha caballi]